MIYNYKSDYKKIYDGMKKVEQEIVVSKKIIDLLNKNKYNNIEELSMKNPTLQDFLKNNHMENALRHFNILGNPLNDDDYKKIVNNIYQISNEKRNSNQDINIAPTINENNIEQSNNIEKVSYQKILKPQAKRQAS